VNDKGPGAPYIWGQEGLAIARSKDGGKTWVKDDENNVKIDPPQNVSVKLRMTDKQITGWRDPIISSWKAADAARSLSEPRTYAILSGGIEPQGPTFFLYELDLASPHTSWKELGLLIEPEARPKRPETKWTGDRGWNWECGGFFELDGVSYLIFSSEGDWFEPFDGTPYVPKPPKWQLWFRGSIQLGSDGSPKFRIEQEGILDWGSYYAAQSFEEKPGGRRLFYGG
jgi:beta-fructofuranosidase